MDQNDKLIKEFLTAVGIGWTGMDSRTLEVNVFNYDPLIAKEWTEDHTITMLKKVKESGLNHKKISGLLHNNPSAIRCFMCYDLLMAKLARFGAPLYLEIFNFYTEILKVLCREDIFVKNFKNIIHSQEETDALIAQCQPASPEIAKTLGKLANACYNLSYGLYSDMNPQLTYDNFGPYYKKNNSMFAVKIFHNLRAPELWPESGELAVNNIDIHLLYQDVNLKIDAATHGIYQGDQINGLQLWHCQADGKVISINEVNNLRLEIEKIAVKIYTAYKQFGFEKKKEFYYFQKAWGYKLLFDFLGLNWQPSSRVLNSAKNKPLFKNWNNPPTKQAEIKYIEGIFDPRTEIPSISFKK